VGDIALGWALPSGVVQAMVVHAEDGRSGSYLTLTGRDLQPRWKAEPFTAFLTVDLRVVPLPRRSNGLVGPVVAQGFSLRLLGVDHTAAADANEVTNHECSARSHRLRNLW